jgi:hypothetical protein
MNCSAPEPVAKVVVDSIHGDIHLTDRECRVIDTASFQRLRYIKQLGMAHFTYQNATHTRFAHSLGVLAIMKKVLAPERRRVRLTDDQEEDLRLAALLHDVGHYPYSHLMEKVDSVRLSEEFVEGAASTPRIVIASPYPSHVDIGRLIVTEQKDLIDALGSRERAERIANLFSRTQVADQQLSKLISSSLDLDRFDYLLRDARGTGTPYGQVDLNYLLNSIRMSPSGLLGVSEKALPAAEHLLFARYFMHRTVYAHKTTMAFEEACRQLLRRIRDAGRYGLPKDGPAVESLVKSQELGDFTDAYVDHIVQRAINDEDPVIAGLASAIRRRQPPKLLKEVLVLQGRDEEPPPGSVFKLNCRHRLRALAQSHGFHLGQFLLCETKPLLLEDRPHRITASAARELPPEEEDPLIKVFVGQNEEPVSIVDVPHSIIGKCADFVFQAFRLYFVPTLGGNEPTPDELRCAVADWHKSD